MKKAVLILLIFSATIALIACGRRNRNDNTGITSPSDIYCPPSMNEDPKPPESETPSAASPSDIIPADDIEITEESGILPFHYKASYKPEAHRFEDMKSWISSIDGLPGFTANGTFDPKLGNYIITGGMGGSEAIDYIEVTERSIKVFFHPDIPLGPTMQTCPGGVMINSYKEEVTGGDGQKYLSTLHKYYINDGQLFTVAGENADYLLFSFEKPIAEPIADFYVYWGAVD